MRDLPGIKIFVLIHGDCVLPKSYYHSPTLMQLFFLVKVTLKMLCLHSDFSQLFLIQLWHYNHLVSSVSLGLPERNSSSFTPGVEFELDFLEQLSKLNKLHQPDFRPEPFSQVQPHSNSLFVLTSTVPLKPGFAMRCIPILLQMNERSCMGQEVHWHNDCCQAEDKWIGSFPYEKKLFPQPLALAHQTDTHTHATPQGNGVHTYSSCGITALLPRKAVSAQPQDIQAESFRTFWAPGSNLSPSRH